MKYIQDLHIGNFRILKDLKLPDLGEINILFGKNNSGKTSVLEAIGILENPFELGSIIHVGQKREILNNQSSPYIVFKNMLNQSSNSINITGKIKKEALSLSITGKNISVVTDVPYPSKIEAFEGAIKVDFGEISKIENITILQTDSDFIVENSLNIVPIVHVTPIDHLLDNSPKEVVKKGKKKELIQLLTIFDKNIIGLEMIEENKKTVPYIESKETGLMPLSTYGDGLKKVLLLGASIIKAEKGVLLIDEIETAIHTGALEKIFKWLIETSNRYKVQMFATTHSLEAVDALLKCANDYKGADYLKEPINIITLRKEY